jgi:hypothetical protein
VGLALQRSEHTSERSLDRYLSKQRLAGCTWFHPRTRPDDRVAGFISLPTAILLAVMLYW